MNELLELIRILSGCRDCQELKEEPWNSRARDLLRYNGIVISMYSFPVISETFSYIYGKEVNIKSAQDIIRCRTV